MRRAILAAAAITAALALAGCASSDGLAQQYGQGQGYVSGDGAYLELAPSEREAPIAFRGPTVDGGELSSEDLAGRVAVVNFWYAGCPPCRDEAPRLKELAESMPDVAFVGVNVYDTAEVARTFEEEFGIEYPSIVDVHSGAVQLAFAGSVAPNAVPTTLVLDPEGRVAARISGVIREASILRAMIERVQEDG